MPERVRIFIQTKGLDKLIKALDEVAKPPSFKVISKLETVLEAGFADTQARVHTISFRLKDSGYTESDLKGHVWSGSINYGGRAGTPAYYAIYELNRPGTRPDGTPHDFFAGMAAYDDAFQEALDEHFKAL